MEETRVGRFIGNIARITSHPGDIETQAHVEAKSMVVHIDRHTNAPHRRGRRRRRRRRRRY